MERTTQNYYFFVVALRLYWLEIYLKAFDIYLCVSLDEHKDKVLLFCQQMDIEKAFDET